MSLSDLPKTIEFLVDNEGACSLCMIDQRKLPHKLVRVSLSTYEEVIDAIACMLVRGAPAIGASGAAALTLWACNQSEESNPDDFAIHLRKVAAEIEKARPTAINLSYEVHRLYGLVHEAIEMHERLGEIKAFMIEETQDLFARDEKVNRQIGKNGARLFKKKSTVLTHCNAGSLATVFFGTALGVIYTAFEEGSIEKVYVDETRPVNQGARLTAWELSRVGVPSILICDNMAASVMSKGEIDAVIVGADRICANGDFANKIGTYALAVLANHHDIPLYVAAPISSFDVSLSEGSQIPIEIRSSEEVCSSVPMGVEVYNPSFDVTPADLISAFITEKGVFSPREVHGMLQDEQ